MAVTETIMIVANDLNTVYLLQRYAETSGFRTIRMGTNDPIIQMMQKVRPVLVIFDDEIWTGAPTILQELEADLQTCDIPVLTYSPLSEPYQIPRFSGYTGNIVGYDDLLSALQRMGIQP